MSYRILSLDGGGSWALIQVRALQEIYGKDMRGHELLSQFDLVAANSGGSIVAAALACDFKLSEIFDPFDDPVKRKTVFVKIEGAKVRKTLGLGARYSTKAKLVGLQSLLKWPAYHAKPEPLQPAEITLDRLPAVVRQPGGRDTHFLIVTFDYDRQRGGFLRSNSASLAASSSPKEPPNLAQAVHASTNAPVNYFDKPAEWQAGTAFPRRYWDGGISGHNNPVLAAVTEALANGVRREDIVVLSIGTGTVLRPLEDGVAKPPLAEPRAGSGLFTYVKKLATAVISDPPDSASFIAHVSLSQPLSQDPARPAQGSVVRMNPLVQPIRGARGWFVPEGFTPQEFDDLANLDMDAVAQSEVELIKRFCEGWISGTFLNQPIRAVGGSAFQVEIGQRSFADAKRQWLDVA
jgi:predicted acylesterase/phospholipase RssA